MKSRTTVKFRQCFAVFPEQVQKQTRQAYRQFKKDQITQVYALKKYIPNYLFTLPELAKVIEQLDN